MTTTAPPDNAVVAGGAVLDLRMIPMEEMAPDVKDVQPRRTFDVDKIAELGKSLVTRQTTPLKVRPVRAEEAGVYPSVVKWIIVTGERRWRAATDAGVPQLRAEVVWSLAEPDGYVVLEEQLIENLQRVDLTPMEEATAIRQYAKRTKLGTREIAARLGKNQMYVSLALGMDKMPADLLKKIERNERGGVGDHGVEAHPLTWKHLRALLRLKDHPVELNRVYDDAIVERSTSREVDQSVEWALQTIERERKAAERATQAAAVPKPGGRSSGIHTAPAPLSALDQKDRDDRLDKARMTRARKDVIRGMLPDLVRQVKEIAVNIVLPAGMAQRITLNVRCSDAETGYAEDLAQLIVPELSGEWQESGIKGSAVNAGGFVKDDQAGRYWLAFTHWLATETKRLDKALDRAAAGLLKDRDKGAAKRAAKKTLGMGGLTKAKRGSHPDKPEMKKCAKDGCATMFAIYKKPGRDPKYCAKHRSR